MNNLKLTLATTLSVLALAFSGAASANRADGEYQTYHQNNKVIKTVIAQPIKKVVVKHTPTKKIVITKTIYDKPKKARFVSNKRFNKSKRYNKRLSYKNRYKHYSNNNRFSHHKRFSSKKLAKQTIYRVRPGDTLIQVSFKTGVSVLRLARLNGIKYKDLNHLKIGQKLRLV